MPVVLPGYRRLSPGAEYINFRGSALPIAGLAGRRVGSCFEPVGSSDRYLIQVRTASNEEVYKAVKASTPSAPVAIDLSDWK